MLSFIGRIFDRSSFYTQDNMLRTKKGLVFYMSIDTWVDCIKNGHIIFTGDAKIGTIQYILRAYTYEVRQIDNGDLLRIELK